MFRPFLACLILLASIILLAYTVLFPSVKASPKELTVVTKTRGHEVLRAELVDDQVTATLKNNHDRTITAFSIRFGDTLRITPDFAYSEIHRGIAPGDTFKEHYQLSSSDVASGPPTLYLLTVLLEGGGEDGDPVVTQRIKDARLGQKIQIFRTLKILEKEAKLPRNLKALKDDVDAALNTEDSDALNTLNELQPGNPRLSRKKKLSDDVKEGLQVGRGKMLQRLEALEQFPSDLRENAFMELKTRTRDLLTKL